MADEDPTPNRIEYDEQAGGFRIVLGGREVLLPELRGPELDEWIRDHALVSTAHVDQVDELESIEDPIERLRAVLNRGRAYAGWMVDAIERYDLTGALGGLDWIRQNMSKEQVLVLVRRLVRQASRSERRANGSIRVTFYTPSDDFSYETDVEEAREWLRARGKILSLGTRPDGSRVPSRHIDQIDGSTVALWYAAVSLAEVRRKGEAGRPVNVMTAGGEWVSIRAERVEATGAEFLADESDDGDADDGDDEPDDGAPEIGPLLEDLDWEGPVH